NGDSKEAKWGGELKSYGDWDRYSDYLLIDREAFKEAKEPHLTIRIRIDGSSTFSEEIEATISKLEKGTVATDWSPAPEDIFARIDNVDKAHVGLSNVQNYGIALESQAKAGVSNATYMTPLRTKQAIEALGGGE